MSFIWVICRRSWFLFWVVFYMYSVRCSIRNRLKISFFLGRRAIKVTCDNVLFAACFWDRPNADCWPTIRMRNMTLNCTDLQVHRTQGSVYDQFSSGTPLSLRIVSFQHRRHVFANLRWKRSRTSTASIASPSLKLGFPSHEWSVRWRQRWRQWARWRWFLSLLMFFNLKEEHRVAVLAHHIIGVSARHPRPVELP